MEKNFASRYMIMNVKAGMLQEKIEFEVDRMCFTMKLTNSNQAVKFKLEDKLTKITPEEKTTREKLNQIKITLAKSGVGEGSLHLALKEITSYLAKNTSVDLIAKAAVKEFVI